MKYALILGDGMGDYPVPGLGGRTPLEVADKPCMNELAVTGRVGLVKTVPAGSSPAAMSPISARSAMTQKYVIQGVPRWKPSPWA